MEVYFDSFTKQNVWQQLILFGYIKEFVGHCRMYDG